MNDKLLRQRAAEWIARVAEQGKQVQELAAKVKQNTSKTNLKD
jgi:hypothetical protein